MSASSFVITTPPQFDFRQTVPSHGWIMLAPFQWGAASGWLRYVYESAAGDVLRLSMTAVSGGLQVHTPDVPEIDSALRAELTTAVKRMLNMAWDLRPFYAAMRKHNGYAWLKTERQGRLLISPSLWEDLAKVLLTTNCSWANTVAWSGRLCQLGAPHPTSKGTSAFPTPQHIAQMEFAELADALRAGYRNAYLHELAKTIANGEVDLSAWLELDSDAFCAAVKSLKGFGDYAARTLACMYGHFDQIAVDSSVRAMYATLHKHGEKADAKEITTHYRRFGEWSGLVLWLDNKRYWSARD
ncbi:MAG: hypothetical protein OXE46_15655 [Chloroflexi bacterium]|nr:hypothetical protein [Chloroflexota bacterium]